jgi:BirA family biotin operon repressor/biotin-[acetyl-CoA-carboxylase] ligase
MSDPLAELAPARVQALLRTRAYGRSLELRPSTESTNDDARLRAAEGAPDGHVVLADTQRKGRGQQGRSWASPAGSDLYLSIVARPALSFAELPPLTLAVGLGVAEAAEQLLAGAGAPVPAVKWPNDVWLGDKKCAGVLLETSSAAQAVADPGAARIAVVVGIGLNVNRLEWPEELRASATSLRAERPAAQRLDRAEVLAALLLSVEQWVDRLVASGAETIASALAPRLLWHGRRVRCGDAVGTLTGVAPTGALRIATAAGTRELLAGRVELAD